MKVYKGFTASPGLVLGQVSRLDRPPLVFGEGPFHPEQEKQALEDASRWLSRSWTRWPAAPRPRSRPSSCSRA